MKPMQIIGTELSKIRASSTTTDIGGMLPREDPEIQKALKVYKFAGQGGLWMEI